MNTISYGLVIAGLFSIALGLLHLPRIWGSVFPQWDAEINGMSLLSRKLMDTVLVAFCLALVALGSITLFLARDTASLDGPQAQCFLFACFLFWLWRFAWQVLYFPYRKLQPTPRLLGFHVALISIFVTNTAAYLAPVLTTLKE